MQLPGVLVIGADIRAYPDPDPRRLSQTQTRAS